MMGKWKVEDIYAGDPSADLEEFTCRICLSFLHEPIQLNCSAKHVFCSACVADCLACPTCRDPLPAGPQKGELLHLCNKPLARMLNRTKVRCPYSTRGNVNVLGSGAAASSSSTRAPGSVSSKESGNATSDASGPSDADRFVPKELYCQDVNKSTESANTSCEQACTWTGDYGDFLAHHLRVCPEHVIQCPHGCGKEVRRRDVGVHGEECTKLRIACKICGEKVRPEDMEKHNEDSARLHVSKLQDELRYQVTEHQLELLMRPYRPGKAEPEGGVAIENEVQWMVNPSELFQPRTGIYCGRRKREFSSPRTTLPGVGPLQLRFGFDSAKTSLNLSVDAPEVHATFSVKMFKKRDGQLVGEKKTIKRAREGENSVGEMTQFCASINSATVKHETAVYVRCRVDKVERRLLKSPAKAFKGFVIRIDTQAVRRQWGALMNFWGWNRIHIMGRIFLEWVVVILVVVNVIQIGLVATKANMACSLVEYSLGLNLKSSRCG